MHISVSKNNYWSLTCVLMLVLTSCEEPFIPDTNPEDQKYVIEGFVEEGNEPTPPYVIVTRSIPFISKVDQSTFEQLFVSDAEVSVNDGSKEVQLIKLCTNDENIPIFVKEAVAAFLGIDSIGNGPNICIYIDIFGMVDVKEGGKYDLSVKIGDYKITASTTIPQGVPLYDFRWDDPPGEPSDSLARLWVKINDPIGHNYYRYQTGVGERGFIAPFQSVTNDVLFEGQEFEFPLNKAEYPEDEVDFNNFGLYPRGDSIQVKWMTIDSAHFTFWNTRDFAASSGGPFSSYTRIAGNVNGALGVWGGYASRVYRTYCPPR